MAGRAGGRATRGHLERVAALAGDTRLAARQIVAVAVLAAGEIPPGVPHQVAVELRVVRIENSALVDAGAEERELPVHHPGAHGGVGPGDRLVDRIGAGWIDGLEQERVRLTCHRNRRLKGTERLEVRGGPVPGRRGRSRVAGVAARGGERGDLLLPAHRIGQLALLRTGLGAGAQGEPHDQNSLQSAHSSLRASCRCAPG